MPRISDFARPGVDFLGLELRQLLALDQLPGKFLSVFGLCLGRNEVFQLAGRNDARIVELLDELFEGDGHDFLLACSCYASLPWRQG